jgi:hypothetical protein
MESSLYNRIYQRVASEVNDDDQFCTYLAEICTDSNSHCDDLRDIIDTMFKTSHPNISETRRQHIIYSLLDIIEEEQQKITEELPNDDNTDDIDRAEQLERNGECKLCACHQKITSMSNKKTFFIDNFRIVSFSSSSSYSKINS